MSSAKTRLTSYTAVSSVRDEAVIASQTGMEAAPHPTIPKRTGFDSRISLTILHHFFTIQSSDEIGIRMGELCFGREGSNKTILLEDVRGIVRQAAVRISKGPGFGLKLLQPLGRGFDFSCSRVSIDPIEPGMAVAVSAKVHAACT